MLRPAHPKNWGCAVGSKHWRAPPIELPPPHRAIRDAPPSRAATRDCSKQERNQASGAMLLDSDELLLRSVALAKAYPPNHVELPACWALTAPVPTKQFALRPL